ncbi:MAG: hypothetical protein AAGF11_32955 [Myxococcota bacterium]
MAPPNDPGTLFLELERRLAEGPLHLRFEVVADGVVEASWVGELMVGPVVDLWARGRFAGKDHVLRLWTEGDRLRIGSGEAPKIDLPRPAALAPALLLGWTRMGVLHNLAMLVGGAPPDHAAGGVEDWVQTVDHRRPTSPGSQGDGVTFGLVVGGEPSGEATLWLDARGTPVRREQTVEFPEGVMRVVERYEVLESALVPAGG